MTKARTPKLTEAQIHKLDALGAHFKFRNMCDRLNQVITSNAQQKRSMNLLMYQQIFSANMPEENEGQVDALVLRDREIETRKNVHRQRDEEVELVGPSKGREPRHNSIVSESE